MRVRRIALIAVACLSIACSRSMRPPMTDKVPLSRVRGIVLVDGVPRAGIHIQYVPQQELAEKRERYLNRFFTWTGNDGQFTLSTYLKGDGIPFGEYALEFKWVEQRLSGEVDRFEGRYCNPASPFLMIKVTGEHDLDLGTIQLKTRI